MTVRTLTWTQACAVAFMLAQGLGLLACDRLFTYRPQQWKPVASSTNKWSMSVGDVLFEHSGIGELTGSHAIMPQFEIRNMSRYPLVVENAALVTASGRQTGRLPQIDGKDVPEARTVKAGATRRIAVLFEFPKPALEDLGPNPQMILEYRLNDGVERLVINYERVS